ncbi:phosphate ABC transporter permease subunit PstC [Puniceicoccaceae bacterium K14]|nr:phosphate ABC transporter permease subunit PstC [Puniceicoccaceae bacterium K14]
MSAPNRYDLSSKQKRFMGLTRENALKGLFGGNAFVSILVLGLITLFLFKEGAGFFGQYRTSLALYRSAGLEYIEIVRDEQNSFAALTQYLNKIQADRSRELTEQGVPFREVKKTLSSLDDFAYDFEDAGYELGDFVYEITEFATSARDQYEANEDYKDFKQNLIDQGDVEKANEVIIEEVDLGQIVATLRSREPELAQLNQSLAAKLTELLQDVPVLEDPEYQKRLERFKEVTIRFVNELPTFDERLKKWDSEKSVSLGTAFTSFVFGKDWVTGGALQDWYGLMPLLTGSLTVAMIAMAIATPLGVGAAIYINQVARPKEQAFVKPYIEFISAIPSVVIGFFGIAIFGEFVREVSNSDALNWISFFPLSERLNAFTAGCLLALMAVPTIFTLAEDSLNNVPRAYKEASFAMGANRIQTIVRIIVPTALSGMISAVLLGFGRVIGETMVVLLCAGNRISIPDFSKGVGTVFEPVHTMTGIIAQELGEVEYGSIHYRALFMIGLVLFALSLLINYAAQKIVMKYQISRG